MRLCSPESAASARSAALTGAVLSACRSKQRPSLAEIFEAAAAEGDVRVEANIVLRRADGAGGDDVPHVARDHAYGEKVEVPTATAAVEAGA